MQKEIELIEQMKEKLEQDRVLMMAATAIVEPETDETKRIEQLKELRSATKELYEQVEDEKHKAYVLKDRANAYVQISEKLASDRDKPSQKLKLIQQDLSKEKQLLLGKEKKSAAIQLAARAYTIDEDAY